MVNQLWPTVQAQPDSRFQTASPKPCMLEALVPDHSIYCGTRLGQISLPDQCSLLGLVRNREVLLLDSALEVHAGDYLLALAFHPMRISELKFVLKKTHPVAYFPHVCRLSSRKFWTN